MQWNTRLSSGIVDATIEVFNTITRELLPTPQKSHYTFNLRDMAKVFQGEMCAHACYHNENDCGLVRFLYFGEGQDRKPREEKTRSRVLLTQTLSNIFVSDQPSSPQSVQPSMFFVRPVEGIHRSTGCWALT